MAVSQLHLSDWLNISGAFSGWVSLLVSLWALRINRDTTAIVDRLAKDIVDYRKNESRRVDQLINTIKSQLKRRKK